MQVRYSKSENPKCQSPKHPEFEQDGASRQLHLCPCVTGQESCRCAETPAKVNIVPRHQACQGQMMFMFRFGSHSQDISLYIHTNIPKSKPQKLLAPGLWIRDTHLYQNMFIHSSTDEHLNCSYLMFKLLWTSAHIPFVDTGWQTSWEIHKIGTNGPEDRFIFDALKLPPGMRVLPSPFRHQVQTAFLRQLPSWRCSTHLAVTWRPLGTGGTKQLSCSLAALQVFLWDRACLNLWPLFALVCIFTTEIFNKARSKYLQIFSIRPWLVLSFLSMIFNKDKGLLYRDEV